jgi:2-dehydropantoate 2-reductase
MRENPASASRAHGSSSGKRSSIAVVGLGSIGGILAGSLQAANRHDLIVCTRAPPPRLIVERPHDVIDVSIGSLGSPQEAQVVDWVLLCTKIHQTPAAAPWLARLCGPQTRVAVLQNGLRHAERLAPLVGPATVVPTIVYYNGERLAPDRVRWRHAGEYDLAVLDDANGVAFAQLLIGTPFKILVSRDFATLTWRKLLLNAVANPVTALTLQRQAVFRREDIQALCLAILEEAATVGRADGAQLAPDEAAQTLSTLLTYPPEAGTSMYFDRLAGRALEVEALTGAIVSVGEQLGRPTPFNRMALALLRAISEAAGPASR